MSEDLFRVQEVSRKSLHLHRGKKQEWVEASFVDPDIQDGYTMQYGQTDGYLGRLFTPKLFAKISIFVLIVLSILILRSMQVQVVQGASYKEKADQNRLRIDHIRADRGLIYDRYKIPLVQNSPNYVLTIQPNLLPVDLSKRQSLLRDLYQSYLLFYRDDTQDEFLSSIEDLYQNYKKRGQATIVAEFIKQDDSIALQLLAEKQEYLSVELFSRREYLNEGPPSLDTSDTRVYAPVKSLSHLLGYMARLNDSDHKELSDNGYLFNDVIGRSGLEYTYEEQLRGEFGNESLEVNAMGTPQQVIAQKQAVDGLSLLTTIDVEFQRAAEEILQNHLIDYEKERGSVVILNPQNGQVISMVSLPTFDNNDFAKRINSDVYSALIENENKPLYNRAVSGEYPSGSTFKPIVAGAALDEGIVTPYTNFLSTGGIRIKTWFFPDWKAGGHGQTNVYHALADSVNTYFYAIGGGVDDFEGLGVAKISDYAYKFGLSQPLGIDLPSESAGFLPSKEWKEATKNERWYIGDTYHLAIGQGDLLVTPLQVASFISTFANGGTVYQPYLVSGFLNQNQELIEEVKPTILNQQVLSQENIQVIQDGLRRVVTQGSGQRLGTLPIEVSGKTGTAQWHPTKPPHAWFAGYAPTENPQIAFSILVEEGEEGSKIAVSIANDLLQWWYDNRIVLE